MRELPNKFSDKVLAEEQDDVDWDSEVANVMNQLLIYDEE